MMGLVSDIYLHIGATKTGTTYIQTVLGANAEALAGRGYFWPEPWGEQVTATNALVGHGTEVSAAPNPQLWDSFCERIGSVDAQAVLVSMEFLSFADADAARRAVESFGSRRVRVILTARALDLVVPAVWQESVQNMGRVPYGPWLTRLTAPGRMTGTARSFWGQQDLARMLRTWGPLVAPEDLVLVTVPRPGADRTLLWRRFAVAAQLRPDEFDADLRANESLGAVSAELMRRLNVAAHDAGMRRAEFEVLKWQVAKTHLAARKSNEPALLLPTAHRAWVREQSQRLLREVRATSPVVVGDLADLEVPAADAGGGRGGVTAPSELPDDQLLGAASAALLGMVGDEAARRRTATRRRRRRARNAGGSRTSGLQQRQK